MRIAVSPSEFEAPAPMNAKLKYASRVVAKPGEARSGDAVYARIDDAAALFVLIDAVGHGDAAFLIAQRALSALEELPSAASALDAISALNAALQGSRGASATAFSVSFSVDDGDAQIAGVGNVACRGIGFRCQFVPLPGVLGQRKQLHGATHVAMTAGQGLVLHSDGISHRFEAQSSFIDLPQSACDYILSHHRHLHDDASVLVIAAKSQLGKDR